MSSSAILVRSLPRLRKQVIAQSFSRGSLNCTISSAGTLGKGFLPSCENNNRCLNRLTLSCLSQPAGWVSAGFSPADRQSAVITADWEPSRYRSSCDQTTESRWLQRHHNVHQYEFKEEPAPFKRLELEHAQVQCYFTWTDSNPLNLYMQTIKLKEKNR